MKKRTAKAVQASTAEKKVSLEHDHASVLPRNEQEQGQQAGARILSKSALYVPVIAVILSLASLTTAWLGYRVNDTALKQVQRAYLVVDCEPDKTSPLMAYRVIVRNLGNTPALAAVAHAVGFKYYKSERTKSIGTVGPKEGKLLVNVTLQPELFNSKNVAFRGELKYEDIFGSWHTDPFCFQALAGQVYICDDTGGPGSFDQE